MVFCRFRTQPACTRPDHDFTPNGEALHVAAVHRNAPAAAANRRRAPPQGRRRTAADPLSPPIIPDDPPLPNDQTAADSIAVAPNTATDVIHNYAIAGAAATHNNREQLRVGVGNTVRRIHVRVSFPAAPRNALIRITAALLSAPASGNAVTAARFLEIGGHSIHYAGEGAISFNVPGPPRLVGAATVMYLAVKIESEAITQGGYTVCTTVHHAGPVTSGALPTL